MSKYICCNQNICGCGYFALREKDPSEIITLRQQFTEAKKENKQLKEKLVAATEELHKLLLEMSTVYVTLDQSFVSVGEERKQYEINN
jgi:hypothetical protein